MNILLFVLITVNNPRPDVDPITAGAAAVVTFLIIFFLRFLYRNLKKVKENIKPYAYEKTASTVENIGFMVGKQKKINAIKSEIKELDERIVSYKMMDETGCMEDRERKEWLESIKKKQKLSDRIKELKKLTREDAVIKKPKAKEPEIILNKENLNNKNNYPENHPLYKSENDTL